MLAELRDEVSDLCTAPEEAVGLLLTHRAQADERLVDDDRLGVPIKVEDGLEQLR
jgi:hypothetical protein